MSSVACLWLLILPGWIFSFFLEPDISFSPVFSSCHDGNGSSILIYSKLDIVRCWATLSSKDSPNEPKISSFFIELLSSRRFALTFLIRYAFFMVSLASTSSVAIIGC